MRILYPNKTVSICRKHSTNYDDISFLPPEHQLRSKTSKFGHALFPHYGITQLWNQLEITHYRLATFVNLTVAALDPLCSELTALGLMTTQNRLVLDILLANEGGVCAMIGEGCCTYVPDNDAHGNISRVVSKMKDIAKQLHMDEHGANTLADWGYSVLGRWTYSLMSVIVIILLFFLLAPCLFQCCQMYQLVKIAPVDLLSCPPNPHEDYTPLFADEDSEKNLNTMKGQWPLPELCETCINFRVCIP